MPSDCQFVKSLKTNKAISDMIKRNCYVFLKSTDIYLSTSSSYGEWINLKFRKFPAKQPVGSGLHYYPL